MARPVVTPCQPRTTYGIEFPRAGCTSRQPPSGCANAGARCWRRAGNTFSAARSSPYDHLTAKIAELDALVTKAVAPFVAVIARLMTIPGNGRRTTEVIVAETGEDMTRFATSARLAAWAGAGARRQRVGWQAQVRRRPPGQPVPARGHDRVSLGHRPHAYPARRPVPPPGARRFGICCYS